MKFKVSDNFKKQINEIMLRMPFWTRAKFILYTYLKKKEAIEIFKKYA